MHAHHDFTCGFLSKGRPPPNSVTPFSGKLTRVFFVLITSRLDYYHKDPRPSFKANINGTFLFDKNTKVQDCSDLYSGLPAYTFSVTTNGDCMLLTAESHDEMTDWLDAIRECIENQVHILRGTLWKKTAKRPKQPWIPRDVELGHVSLTYVTQQFHLKVRNHVKLTSRSFVVDLEPMRHAHVFGICTGESSITFAAATAHDKDRWLREIEIRIAKQRIHWRTFQKPSDLAGHDIRRATSHKWKRRFCELERGAMAIKLDERRLGMELHVPLELVTAIEADPADVGRSNAFGVVRFGEVKLFVSAFSVAEKRNWLAKIDMARRDMAHQKHTYIFPDAIKALMANTGYRTIKVAATERLDVIMEQFRERILVLVPTACEEAATYVPKASVLVSVTDQTGRHSSFDAMWHLLRIQSRPLKMTFRLPIAKDGLLRMKTALPVPQWVPRRCVVETGALKWFSLQENQPQPIQVVSLRDCSVTLLRDFDADFGEMPNCFVLTCNATRVLFSASSAQDCVLWMAILQLEICTFSGDIRFAPSSPTVDERRRNKLVKHVKFIADKVYATQIEGDDKGETPPPPPQDVAPPPSAHGRRRKSTGSIASSSQAGDDFADDDFDDDEYLSFTERLHRHLVERPQQYIAATREDAKQRATAYIQERRQSIMATPMYKRLSEAKERMEVQLAPAKEELEKMSKKATEVVKETARDIRSHIVIPDPETSDYFNGSKRYLSADILGKSVRRIEQRSAKNAQRYIETEDLVKSMRTGVPMLEVPVVDVNRPAVLTADAARRFFVELTHGATKTSYEALVELLRSLCVSQHGNVDNLAPFETALLDLEGRHRLTYAIPIDMFVEVAAKMIHDAPTIKAMDRLAKGVLLPI
ncbi:Aste57867_25252 [Aphanomyces stellatus]|uniref:Aste57867_25252 protein n=1 Tax=Aphanomyces stellatus TaxID=120398 RepID=A0A485LSQ5_9STRA|nr:hypothetical protein As57867_025174 [Aphanomyces stellatus]VFU01878.1 Aste57867_25252 [Aphanomyces stellatus]